MEGWGRVPTHSCLCHLPLTVSVKVPVINCPSKKPNWNLALTNLAPTSNHIKSNLFNTLILTFLAQILISMGF